MSETNRRSFPRRDEKATIQILISGQDSKDRQDGGELIPVKMSNQSQAGLCIETDRTLDCGSNVSLKMVSPEEDHPEDAHYICDGQVVWCKNLNGETDRFGVGIKIIRKVVEAEVLTTRFK